MIRASLRQKMKKKMWMHKSMRRKRWSQSRSPMTKCTSTSLTSNLIFLALRYSNPTDVYRGTKLLGGSHESLDAAKPFHQTLHRHPPGVQGSGLSERMRSAVYSSSSLSLSESMASAVNSKVTARPWGSGSRSSN